MVAMTSRALGRLTPGRQHRRMPAGFVTPALGQMAAATKHRHLFPRRHFVWGGTSGRQAVLLAGTVASVATDVFLEVRMALHVTGRLRMAGLTELMHLPADGQSP